MKLDECKPTTFPIIKACVQAELRKGEVQRQLQALAQQLVDERQTALKTSTANGSDLLAVPVINAMSKIAGLIVVLEESERVLRLETR